MTTDFNSLSLSTSSPLLNQYAVQAAFITPPIQARAGLARRSSSVPLIKPFENENFDCFDNHPNIGSSLLSKIDPFDAEGIPTLFDQDYDPRRVELKPYPGHIWLAEHPTHIEKETDFSQRSILIHAGGTLEQPDKVHEDLWPQLSRLGNLDLAVVDFGPLALLRSNQFHEKRVISALKYLVELGYRLDRIALSGGSKGAYAAARANAQFSSSEQRLGALVLCSPVLSAHSALNILLNDLPERPECPRWLKILLHAIARLVSPKFLDIREIEFDPKTPTFIIQGGQDWAHDESSDSELNNHINKFFIGPGDKRNLNWITYQDEGHRLQIKDHHARWVLAFLTDSKVGKILGALEHQRYNKFPPNLNTSNEQSQNKISDSPRTKPQETQNEHSE